MSFLGLEGRRVLITGASSGIGRAVALELDEAGAGLVLVGRDLARLEAVAQSCRAGTHLVQPFDLSENLEEIPGWIKALAETGGPFAGVVHAAGVQSLKLLRTLRPADLDLVFRLNVHAGIMLARGFRQPGVKDEMASLVFLSSVMGSVGSPGRIAYGSSKGAIEAAVRSLALELAPEGLRVNCVAPGFVDSEMLQSISQMIGPEQTARVRDMHPLGFGAPNDVAKAVAFLLGSCSRWATGSTLLVDGGYSAH